MKNKNLKVCGKSCTYPISFIAYANDENTLISSFEKLVDNLPDVEYCYIFHKGENGDKNHYHCLMRNNSVKGFQNVPALLRYFMQPCKENIYVKDSNGNDVLRYAEGEEVCFLAERKFLITNSLGDWYEYVLHNEEYLQSKGEKQ